MLALEKGGVTYVILALENGGVTYVSVREGWSNLR